MDINEILEKTICTHCSNCCFRQIVPEDYDEEGVFLHVCCKILDIDVNDHLTISCSDYKENVSMDGIRRFL